MIGLTRLKRAIADVPTGGMQTGDPKVPLKLCDAQRLEVEFNAIIAERDAALAQNAEAFGDGYYDGFLDGAKHHESTDCNTDPTYLGDDAMHCSEIAEGEKSKLLGIVSRQELMTQNADLVAQVAQLELNTESLMSIIKSKTAAHVNMNVSEIQAATLAAAATYLSESIPDKSHESVIFKDGYVYISTRYLREYAERVKAGEA